MLTPCNKADSTAHAIANGFDRARELYANTEAAREAATGDDPTQVAINRFNDARNAQRAYGSDGSIYNAVYEEEAAKQVVQDAIKDWNALFSGDDPKYTNASTIYDALLVTGLNTFDKDGGDATSGIVANAYGPVSARGAGAAAQGFRAIGTVDDAALTEITDTQIDGAFNAESGALLFAQNPAVDDPGTTNNDESKQQYAGSSAITNLGEIRAHLDLWEKAVTRVETALGKADATTGNVPAIEKRLARAKKARDHVQAELDRLTTAIRTLNASVSAAGARVEDGTTGAITSAVAVRNYGQALRDLATAESKIRNAVAARETATGEVKKRLESADSYLKQLVELREFEKQELIDLHDGSPPQAQLKAKNDAVTNAQQLLQTHQSLIADPDSPAAALRDALLATEDPKTAVKEDDDGLALLRAVSSVDKNTAANKGEIDALKGQLTDAEGNPIDLSNLGNAEEIMQLTTDVSENSDDIMELDGRVAENESDIGQIQTDLYGTTSGQHDGSGRL